jgi:hypothetical protein
MSIQNSPNEAPIDLEAFLREVQILSLGTAKSEYNRSIKRTTLPVIVSLLEESIRFIDSLRWNEWATLMMD